MIPMNKEKAYDRIQHQFIIFLKNLRKIGIKKNILNLKKRIYKKKKKGTTNITLDDEKIAALPLRLGKRHLLSNIAPEVLASAAEQEKGKRHTD